jgi:hypothetical protein
MAGMLGERSGYTEARAAVIHGVDAVIPFQQIGALAADQGVVAGQTAQRVTGRIAVQQIGGTIAEDAVG